MYYYLLMELLVLSVLTTIEKELPYKLYGAGHDYKQEETHRPFGFPVYQMLLCTNGHGILEMNGQKYPIYWSSRPRRRIKSRSRNIQWSTMTMLLRILNIWRMAQFTVPALS